MSSPNLQLQSSPRHQNTNIYPYQATSKRPSQQQAMSNSAHHFRPIPPCPFERYSEQLHSSSAGPSRHHSSQSTDLSTNSLPSRQSQPQPMYMHELSPRFQQHHGPSPQVESSSRRSKNSLRERSHQPLSQELVQQQSPRTAITYLIQHLQPSRTSSNTYSRHVPHPTPTGVIGLGIGAAHVPHPTSTAVTVFDIGTSMVSAVNGTISTLFPGKSTSNVPSSNNLSPAVNAAAGWIAPESWAVSPVDGNGSVNTDVDKSKEDDRL
ncbi:hypothetical protein PCANC_23971, partial [Puccinia coronata f. sp. avenae]